jgi:hypothetical protein
MEHIYIEYGVVQDSRGFYGVVRHRGRTWNYLRGRPLDMEEALGEAHQAALEEAARYIGDWKVTITRV